MSVHENCEAIIDRLKQDIEYAAARAADAEKREGELIEELKQSQRREDNLKNAVKGWQQDFAALQNALRAEALAKAAEVFEGYAVHHFLKGADEKAQANRAHAKMCRDALATEK
jgi:hypothetical protein